MTNKNATVLRQSNVLPLRLVNNKVAYDVVDALEQLLKGAKSGDITGIAFACTMKQERFFTDVVGTCYTSPSHARGIVAYLSDEIANIVQGLDQDGSR